MIPKRVGWWILIAKTFKYDPEVEASPRQIITYTCVLSPVICVHCYLTISIYSVTCHTGKQRYTDQAHANTFSICYLFSPLVFLFGMNGGKEQCTSLGSELSELKEVSLLQVHFHKEQRKLHTKREKYQGNKLGPMFQKKNIIVCHKNLSPDSGPQYSHVSHIERVCGCT